MPTTISPTFRRASAAGLFSAPFAMIAPPGSAIHSGEAGPIFGFVVRAMNIEFLKPARMDDLITVETAVIRVGGASAELAQRILREPDPLLTADVRVAAVANGRAFRLPAEIRDKMRAGALRHQRASLR
jgi:Thioesterase superfamily